MQEKVTIQRVLLLAPQMEARGTSEYTVSLARALREREVEVAVFCVPGPSLERLRATGAAVREFEQLHGFSFWRKRHLFLDAVEELDPQLVHAQSYRASGAIRRVSHSTSLPLVLTVHGLPLNKMKLRRVLRRVDAVIATTQSVREGLVNKCKVPRRKVRVIHNGVDAAGMRKGDVPPVFQGALPVVGLLGPVEDLGGHELFLQAVAMLVQQGLAAQFVVAGQGQGVPELREIIAGAGLEQQVTVVTDFACYGEVLGALDVVVQCSLVDMSGFSILEAMANGRPVVAFDTGTACEMVEDSRTGFLVPRGDVDALAQAIECLVRGKELARRMGQRARERVERDFDVHDIARATVEFYAEIIEGRRQ